MKNAISTLRLEFVDVRENEILCNPLTFATQRAVVGIEQFLECLGFAERLVPIAWILYLVFFIWNARIISADHLSV